jgi:hypothetical protein
VFLISGLRARGAATVIRLKFRSSGNVKSLSIGDEFLANQQRADEIKSRIPAEVRTDTGWASSSREDFPEARLGTLGKPFRSEPSPNRHDSSFTNCVIDLSEQFVGSTFEFRSSSRMYFPGDIRLEDTIQFFQALRKHLDRVVNVEQVLCAVSVPTLPMN